MRMFLGEGWGGEGMGDGRVEEWGGVLGELSPWVRVLGL